MKKWAYEKYFLRSNLWVFGFEISIFFAWLFHEFHIAFNAAGPWNLNRSSVLL